MVKPTPEFILDRKLLYVFATLKKIDVVFEVCQLTMPEWLCVMQQNAKYAVHVQLSDSL